MYESVKMHWGKGLLHGNVYGYKGGKKRNYVVKGECLEVEGSEGSFGNMDKSDVQEGGRYVACIEMREEEEMERNDSIQKLE